MESYKKHSYLSLLTPLRAGILLTTLCCILQLYFPADNPIFLQLIDDRIRDVMFLIRGSSDCSGEIVIIDIDEKSLQQFGQWPWPRTKIAELTKVTISSNAKVVGFDMFFPEKDRSSPSHFFSSLDALFKKTATPCRAYLQSVTSKPGFDNDEIFASALGKSPSVLGYAWLSEKRDDQAREPASDIVLSLPIAQLASPFSPPQAVSPLLNLNLLAASAREGFLNIIQDWDGSTRRVPLFIGRGSRAYPSLSLQMLGYNLTDPNSQVNIAREEGAFKGISLGDILLEPDRFGRITLNFRGPKSTFLHLSAADILNGQDIQFLSNKYVLLGSTAAGIADTIKTPFSPNLSRVELQANILDNLLNNDYLRPDKTHDRANSFLVILLGGLLCTVLVIWAGPLVAGTALLLWILGLCIVNYTFYFLHYKLIGVSFSILCLFVIYSGLMLCHYLNEGRKRRFLRRAFAHYLSPSVINELVADPKKLELLAETRETSILFCDIRKFTTLAEDSSPDELASFLNSHFSILTEIILQENGMVDKYIGDAIMAVWGTPLTNQDHAYSATLAALKMLKAVEEHKQLKLSGEEINVGIGINSGLVSAGNFGCSKRFDYTVLGDSVNLASRVESLTRFYPVNIMVTEFTVQRTGDRLRYRYIDTVTVKGRNTSVKLFEPLLPGSRQEIFHDQESQSYQEALDLYRQRNFSAASAHFTALLRQREDPLYQMYQQRCDAYLASPPPATWEGIFNHTAKS